MAHARRILVVSSDAGLGARVAGELGPEHVVDARAALDALGAPDAAEPPAACVLELDAELAVAIDQLPRCPIIVVAPRPSLAAAVELMERADQVVAATARDSDQLHAIVRRVLGEGAPALAARLVIADFADKARCLSAIGAAIEPLGLPRHRRDAIDQCVDEMLMNALYDAPVDAAGAHVFADVPPRARMKLRTAARVVVEWAHAGTRFTVVVRDVFGSLERATVLRNLHRGLHADEAVDRKVGGAGLGLYLMATAASALVFEVAPGVATEVTCVFDDREPELAQLAVVVRERAGATRHAPARRRLATRYRVRRALAVVGAAAAIALGVWGGPRVFGRGPPGQIALTTTAGATIELDGQPIGIATGGTLTIDDLEVGRPYRVTALHAGYDASRTIVRPQRGANAVALALRPVATLELASQPSDAQVEIDEHPAGTTPMRVTSLAPGTTVSIAIAHAGYRPVTTRVEVPAAGGVRRVVQQLEPSDQLVRVHIVSNPPGAAIVRDGGRTSADRTYAPADVEVEANQVQHITLTMPHYAPLAIPPFTVARGDHDVEKVGNLVLEP